MSSISPNITTIKNWLQRHRSSTSTSLGHLLWSSSLSNSARQLTSSTFKMKDRIRNLVRPSRDFRQHPDAYQHTDSPPPYSPTEETPNPFSSPRELDQESPPPGYRPPVGHQPSSEDVSESAHKEQQRFDAFLTLHRWDPSWGPQPVSLSEALKQAAFLGNRQLVLALLDAGAEVKQTKEGAIPEDTAVHSALYGPNPAIALEILGHETVSAQSQQKLLASRNAMGLTPLHVAVEAGLTEAARKLIQLGSPVETVDRFGRAPLHIACRYGRSETVDMLLDEGASTTKINRQLWERAADCPTTRKALGHFGSVSRMLQDAVDRWRRPERGGLATGGTPLPSRTSQIGNSWTPTTNYSSLLDGPPHPPPPKHLALAGAPQDPTVDNMLSNIEPPRRTPDRFRRYSSSDGGSSSRRGRGQAIGNTGPTIRSSFFGPATPKRTGPQNSALMPQYQRWAGGLETLQAESRRQRERNEREIMESGLIPY